MVDVRVIERSDMDSGNQQIAKAKRMNADERLGLKPAQIEKFYETFTTLDDDDSGTLSVHELTKVRAL